jgi:hypothetical protein
MREGKTGKKNSVVVRNPQIFTFRIFSIYGLLPSSILARRSFSRSFCSMPKPFLSSIAFSACRLANPKSKLAREVAPIIPAGPSRIAVSSLPEFEGRTGSVERTSDSICSRIAPVEGPEGDDPVTFCRRCMSEAEIGARPSPAGLSSILSAPNEVCKGNPWSEPLLSVREGTEGK